MSDRPWPAGRRASWLGVIGVLSEGSRLLLIKRAPGLRGAGAWCFPGGSVEPGETAREALVRELAEELGVEVEPGRPLGLVRPPGVPWRLAAWTAHVTCGTLRPAPAEVADVAWLLPDQIRALTTCLPSSVLVLDLLERRA